jgi:hypothetical protein
MSTELSKVDEATITAIETACERCSLARLQTLSPIRRTLELATGMQAIRKHLQGPLMRDIGGLANTALGFMTDRRPGTKDKSGRDVRPYDEDTIRDVVIEGMLRGASVIGNEINVIASRCYLTRQYFERQLREWPGLTELRVTEGVPTLSSAAGGALVPMRASWKLHGQPDELICDRDSAGDFRIPVRVNEAMGVDAILGKARRKLYAKIFARISGSTWIVEQEHFDAPVIDIETTAEPAIDAVSEPVSNHGTNSPADETAAFFRNIGPTLQALEQISDVDTFEQGAAALLTTDEDRFTLKEWCDCRREEIRESRGNRSSKRN